MAAASKSASAPNGGNAEAAWESHAANTQMVPISRWPDQLTSPASANPIVVGKELDEGEMTWLTSGYRA
jgi:hypothetical protein